MVLVKVANVNDLKDGEGKVVKAGSIELALFRRDGKFYAIDNKCAHEGGPLGEGWLEGDIVVCPWHQWRYSIRTGINELMPAVKQKTFSARVEGAEVFVEVPQ